MPTQPPLALVILSVSDLPRSVRFYDAALGWPAVVSTPVYVELELPRGMRLGLYAREGFQRNTGAATSAPPPEHTASTELYFFPDNLLKAIEDVTAAGATLLSPLAPRDWGDDAAYFRDPDGNVLALARESD